VRDDDRRHARDGFARDVADTVVMMDAGAIVERGTLQAGFTSPANARTRASLQAIRSGPR
jgi:polar amino acid transport system ATP-binding protein